MKKILILGKGFMGERLSKEYGAPVDGTPISNFKDAEKVLDHYRPGVLINAIGHTGPGNVDGCELNKDKTLSSNVFVPLILAEASLRRKIKFVHISSGCIYHYDYNKTRPIPETKDPDFLDLFYSRSKIYAESPLEILSRQLNVLIARIRIPLDNRKHPKNILDKLIKYKKVITLPNSVTYIPDFVLALRHLIKNDERGVYNVVNKGGLVYPRLLEVYRRYRPDFKYRIIDHKKLGLVRTNLIMSTKKLQKSGFRVRPIEEVFEECVKNYIAS